MSRTIIENHIRQLKIAFPRGAYCPYCGEWIDPDNPPLKLLVALCSRELFCSAEHFDLYNSSEEKTTRVETSKRTSK